MSQERIFIVEDEFVVRQDLQTTLRDRGYQIVGTADTAERATQGVLQTRPDLVLLDIRLQGNEDGIDAARQIRRVLQTPIIYLTAHGDEETLRRAKTTNPHGYLLKPFNDTDLIVAIEMALARAATERATREDRDWLRTMVESMGDAVAAADRLGLVVHLNPQAEQILGWKQDEALGQPLQKVMPLTNPVTRQPLPDLAEQVLQAGIPGKLTAPALVIRRDGSECLVEKSAAPIRDPNQGVIGVVVVFHDTTERTRTTEALLQMQKREAIGRLAGGISHDFNNLLTIILGSCELALSKTPTLDTCLKALAEIEAAGRQAANVTRQLLAFSRRSLLAPRMLNLNELVIHTCNLLSRLVRDRIHLRFEPGHEPALVFADPGLLQDVLVNLVLNARDASPDGGTVLVTVELLAELPTLRLPVEGKVHGPWARLGVEDSGKGISEEVLATLFEPYHSIKPRAQGSGLGLASVFGTIKQHGGHLDVRSTGGHGTRLEVYLPMTPSSTLHPTTAPSLTPITHSEKSVLVVEDEPGIRTLVELVLRNNGYRVLTAASGPQALEVVSNLSQPIDMLISDVVMPEMNGPTLASQMLARFPKLKVLFVSGQSDGLLEEMGILKPHVHMLHKPFSLASLEAKMTEMFS